MTVRKKKSKKMDLESKHSQTLAKIKKERSTGYEGISGMKNCMFKRECFDDQILENFLLFHGLENNEYNVAQFREFAESSIESPIDFTNLIKSLQKMNKHLSLIQGRMVEISKSPSDYGIEK